ncbi:P2X purinoceptor 7-like [Protopterus annectens]|uniref:P2X purinoceptor 7-like n=1 Tax=Protopterus annectens TaxID=7888 RepID=UPI001CF954E8|nr:P2X purinoceptor 7-like [Protopterus annectens]
MKTTGFPSAPITSVDHQHDSQLVQRRALSTRGGVNVSNRRRRRVPANSIGHLKDQIEALTRQELQGLCVTIAERKPALITELLRARSNACTQQSTRPSSHSVPEWCVCNNCQVMPTEVESVCCSYELQDCISVLQEMQECVLPRSVLQVAHAYRSAVFGLPQEADENKRNRHTAYRQFTLWRYGRLGSRVRRPIPSSCVWHIRDKYPDPQGSYTGFHPSSFDD